MSRSCVVCHAPSSKQCGRCHSMYYCGKEHQESDWAIHRYSCSIHSTIKAIGDETRFAGFSDLTRASEHLSKELHAMEDRSRSLTESKQTSNDKTNNDNNYDSIATTGDADKVELSATSRTPELMFVMGAHPYASMRIDCSQPRWLAFFTGHLAGHLTRGMVADLRRQLLMAFPSTLCTIAECKRIGTEPIMAITRTPEGSIRVIAARPCDDPICRSTAQRSVTEQTGGTTITSTITLHKRCSRISCTALVGTLGSNRCPLPQCPHIYCSSDCRVKDLSHLALHAL